MKLDRSNLSLLLISLSSWFNCMFLVSSEDSRALVYTQGGVVKLIIGWAVPLELPMTVIFLSNYQFQYNALDNATKWHELGRSRHTNVFSRSHFYNFLENSLSSREFDGESCVLRTICEVGEAPLSHIGLTGQFIDLLFKPKRLSIYHNAWIKGTSKGNCSEYVCRRNLFDDWSDVFQ